jgi:enamine deaminase RidA (YjgF/YER057c/UK114 family)
VSLIELLQPDGWPAPKGYAHGAAAFGRSVHVAGQVGWDPLTHDMPDDFAEQVRRALSNIREVLAAAGARPEHVVRLTWFVTSKDEYAADRTRLGEAYRSVMGRHYPPMTVVQVIALMARGAKVEIEATAVVPTTVSSGQLVSVQD